LYAQLHYLGRVVSFVPSRHMSCECSVDQRLAPFLDDFRLLDEPAMPISMLLEYVVAGADWIQPVSRKRMHVHEIRNVECDMRRLKLQAGRFVFSRFVKGDGTEREWIVHVWLAANDERILRADVVYREHPPLEGELVTLPRTGTVRIADRSDLRWSGLILHAGEWTTADNQAWVTTVAPCDPADAWATMVVPTARLPLAHLENAIRLAANVASTGAPRGTLQIDRMRRYCSAGARYVVAESSRNWLRIVDGDARLALEIEGLAFLGAERGATSHPESLATTDGAPATSSPPWNAFSP
jgi:hypothetical protein